MHSMYYVLEILRTLYSNDSDDEMWARTPVDGIRNA